MSGPSPTSHLYRLGIILAVGFVAFIMVMAIAVPANWNYQGWYRLDALEELKEPPLVYGGNESCAACHDAIINEVKKFKHRALSCESCHGPLAHHVKGKQKIADAYIDEDGRWQCLNCHKKLVSKSLEFPVFSRERPREHTSIKPETPCKSCHKPHHPTP